MNRWIKWKKWVQLLIILLVTSMFVSCEIMSSGIGEDQEWVDQTIEWVNKHKTYTANGFTFAGYIDDDTSLYATSWFAKVNQILFENYEEQSIDVEWLLNAQQENGAFQLTEDDSDQEKLRNTFMAVQALRSLDQEVPNSEMISEFVLTFLGDDGWFSWDTEESGEISATYLALQILRDIDFDWAQLETTKERVEEQVEDMIEQEENIFYNQEFLVAVASLEILGMPEIYLESLHELIYSELSSFRLLSDDHPIIIENVYLLSNLSFSLFGESFLSDDGLQDIAEFLSQGNINPFFHGSIDPQMLYLVVNVLYSNQMPIDRSDIQEMIEIYRTDHGWSQPYSIDITPSEVYNAFYILKALDTNENVEQIAEQLTEWVENEARQIEFTRGGPLQKSYFYQIANEFDLQVDLDHTPFFEELGKEDMSDQWFFVYRIVRLSQHSNVPLPEEYQQLFLTKGEHMQNQMFQLASHSLEALYQFAEVMEYLQPGWYQEQAMELARIIKDYRKPDGSYSNGGSIDSSVEGCFFAIQIAKQAQFQLPGKSQCRQSVESLKSDSGGIHKSSNESRTLSSTLQGLQILSDD